MGNFSVTEEIYTFTASVIFLSCSQQPSNKSSYESENPNSHPCNILPISLGMPTGLFKPVSIKRSIFFRRKGKIKSVRGYNLSAVHQDYPYTHMLQLKGQILAFVDWQKRRAAFSSGKNTICPVGQKAGWPS